MEFNEYLDKVVKEFFEETEFNTMNHANEFAAFLQYKQQKKINAALETLWSKNDKDQLTAGELKKCIKVLLD